MPKSARKPKPSKRKPRIVCPICLKLNCPLLLKLLRYKFTDAERRHHLFWFHKETCQRCRLQLILGWGLEDKVCKRRFYGRYGAPERTGTPCSEHPPKEKLKHHIFPDWWTTPESIASEPRPG